MSTRWATGSIAGVDVEDLGGRPCRMDVLDGESLRGTMVGDSVIALDLTVHTQVLNRAGVGARFGLQIAQLPAETLSSIVAAIDAAVGASNSFGVTVADAAGVDDIDVFCVPDFAATDGKIFQRGGMAGGYVKEVIFRFIVVSQNV